MKNPNLSRKDWFHSPTYELEGAKLYLVDVHKIRLLHQKGVVTCPCSQFWSTTNAKTLNCRMNPIVWSSMGPHAGEV